MAEILVIGGAHLDVVAEYSPDYEYHIDKPGSFVEYSVGGAAFNIAANLSRFARRGTEISLMTCIKKDSLSGFLIRSAIERTDIKTVELISDEAYPESGFIAHWSSGCLKSAVSCSNLDQATFSKELLDRRISKANVVVIDTNLTSDQIQAIQTTCHLRNKPLIVGCVSESKVQRIRQSNLREMPWFVLVSMNEHEARSFFGQEYEKSLSPVMVRGAAHAENVIVTKASSGFSVYSGDGRVDFEAPQVAEAVSELGAGDALLSACCEYFLHNRKFDWNDCYEYIKRYVLPILKVRHATIDAARLVPRVQATTSVDNAELL